MDLNSIMEFEHVIRVQNGIVSDAENVWAPETYLDMDENDQVLPNAEAEMVRSLDRHGWELFTTGYSSEYMNRGGVMHSSESIGGQLAVDILERDGYYVAVVVTGLGPDADMDSDPIVGWAVLRRDLED